MAVERIWDHPNRNRWFNQCRLLMRISRTLAIIWMTAEDSRGPELIRTLIVMRIRFFSTNRSRGRRRVWAEQHISSKLDELNVGRMVFEEMRKITYDEVNYHADNVSGHVEKIAGQVRRAWAEHIAKSAEEQEICEIPGCPCNDRVDYRNWNSDDRTLVRI